MINEKLSYLAFSTCYFKLHTEKAVTLILCCYLLTENKADVEQGSKQDNRPPTDEIIPVYRRDCHEEVYCGSHAYPGQGVYLLKFDNSYSLWRSKTLYYRVYYSR